MRCLVTALLERDEH